jgi:preprotein translocase subunit SecD
MKNLFRIYGLLLIILITGCTTPGLSEKHEESNSTKIYFMDSDHNILATGSDIEQDSVEVVLDNISYGVEARFKDPKTFEEITKKMVSQNISIFNNDSLIITIMVSDVITNGHFTIAGISTLEEAMDIERLLKNHSER